MLDTRKLETPNRGIWRSARYGLLGALGGVLGGVLLGVLFGALFRVLGSSVLGGGQDFGLGVVLLLGLLFGLIMGQILGGDAFSQHFILRCFLWKAGLMPWNYVLFLDYAAERILLRKVGGGYIFVHRLLLEYFATLDTASTTSAGTTHLQVAPPAS